MELYVAYYEIAQRENNFVPPMPPPVPKAPKKIKGKTTINPPTSKQSDVAYADKVINETIANQDIYDHKNHINYVFQNGKAERPKIGTYQPKSFKVKEEQNKIDTNDIQEESPKTGFFEVNGQTLYYVTKKNETTYFNRWGQKVNRKGEIINKAQTSAEKVIEGQVISKVYKNDKVVAEFNTENVNIPPLPPTPPEPITPLDNIIEMAKEGAIFKYKEKIISSDEAISIIKNNTNLSISTKKKNNEKPIVKISRSL